MGGSSRGCTEAFVAARCVDRLRESPGAYDAAHVVSPIRAGLCRFVARRQQPHPFREGDSWGIQPCARSVTSTVVPSVLSPTAHLSPGSWRTTNARIRCNRSLSDSGSTAAAGASGTSRRAATSGCGPGDAVADWGPMPRSDAAAGPLR